MNDREEWRERVRDISMQPARHDDDDDEDGDDDDYVAAAAAATFVCLHFILYWIFLCQSVQLPWGSVHPYIYIYIYI